MKENTLLCLQANGYQHGTTMLPVNWHWPSSSFTEILIKNLTNQVCNLYPNRALNGCSLHVHWSSLADGGTIDDRIVIIVIIDDVIISVILKDVFGWAVGLAFLLDVDDAAKQGPQVHVVSEACGAATPDQLRCCAVDIRHAEHLTKGKTSPVR